MQPTTPPPGPHTGSPPPGWTPPPAPPQRTCIVCNSTQLRPVEKALTAKVRPKFGAIWLVITLCSAGLGFLLWLVMPRHDQVIGMDRYVICTNCNARQP